MAKEKTKTPRKPSFAEAVIPMLFMVAALGLGTGIMKWPIELVLLLSAFFAGGVAYLRLGYSYNELQKMIVQKVSTIMVSILIVWVVAYLTASFMFAGTLPMIVYYGIQLVSPSMIYVVAFISTALVSITVGTSWGSAATVGVAMMGVAQGLDVSLPITAAAVVGGAYFGDKMSPMSDTTNLASAISGIDLYEHIKNMFWTTVPSAIIALIVYIVLGMGNEGNATSEEITTMVNQLGDLYNFNILTLLPIVIVLGGALIKMPTLPTMLFAGFVALLIGVFGNGFALLDGLSALNNGFKIEMTGATADDVLPKIVSLLQRGGLKSQGSFLTFIFSAMAFAGIVSGTGMLDRALSAIASKIKSVPAAVFAVIVSCFGAAAMTGSGGLTIVLPGELFRNIFIKLKIHPRVLARTLEDSGTLLMPIIPWTAAGAYMVSVLEVEVLSYLPFAVFNLLGMVFAMIYAFTGISIGRLTDEERDELLNKDIDTSVLG